ncbi:MAG TPA: 4-(cytidine 5'-diphospho)-2-C-methyl-D-erythritol kinase, partial [Anaerovoracaceae bacterium]|nr:4-(cytidine 5'-diphospho)-2-C-methyl-D-erythritol kinase [Anaerovoracaceae bacterium]
IRRSKMLKEIRGGAGMKEITIKAYAKINLSIDVLGERPDGYHEVLMVMEQVDLFDLVKVAWQADHENAEVPQKDEEGKYIQINLSTNLPYLPVDSRNIAYKAAELMAKQFGKEEAGRIDIEVEKSIPVAAGLAGGSANCAAVLHALNRLWDLNLELETLMKLGAGLGADVPFCLAGQAALNEELNLKEEPMAGTCAVASGIGEQLEMTIPLKAWVLLSKPPINLSTAEVYGGLNLNEITEHPNTAELVAGLREGNYYKISKNMTNVLENYSLKEYPTIMYTKNKIVQEGKAYKALMSGSGPTVFGLYTSKRKGIAAYSKLKTLNKETFLIKTL